jgi:uncharacterized protein (DUF885 family)
VDRRVEALADELVDAGLALEPLEGALLGLPARDRPLADLSAASLDASRATVRDLARRAEELAAGPTGHPGDELDAVTLDLVRFSAANLADRLAVPSLEFTVTDRFNAPLAGVLSTVPQLPLDSDERRAEHLARLRALPEFLAQAADQLRAGARSGLTPVARGVRAAIDQIDAVLADPAVGGLRKGDESDAFGRDEDATLRDDVEPAMRRYRQALEDESLPLGRDDDHPGLAWLPGGDEMYRTAIRYSTSTERTAEDLHGLGVALFADLDAEFAELGASLWGVGDAAEVRRRLREDPALRFTTGDEILDAARGAVRRAEAVAPDWFGEVPASACAVEPIPDAMAAGSPAAYYYTGALDGSRPGTYFVSTSEPTERFRHVAEAVAFHEAVPGHHFQLTIAQDLGGHLAHQLFGDVTTAEGWGLYAERLADEMGLYSGDLARLGLVSTDAWRAARLVVDTGLHAMGWTRQRAIDWMAERVPISAAEIASEVDRYITTPGQALAYMVGRLELERLRARSADALGEAFSVRDFHDLVLRTGPVAPPAVAAAVERWIDRATAA